MTEDEPVAKSSLTRADSVDDMIAQVRKRMIMMRVKTCSKKKVRKTVLFQVKLLSQRRPVVKKDSEEDSSGRSTPAHLR